MARKKNIAGEGARGTGIVLELPSSGSLVATEYGPRDAAELVLTVHGIAHELVSEWEDTGIATAAALAGYRVVCLNFHSNSALKPGEADTATIVTAIDEVLVALNYPHAVLMGKSWGGKVAVAVAAARPEKITKLVLSAPAFGMAPEDAAVLSKLKMPICLGWSEDDVTIPHKTHLVYTSSGARRHRRTAAVAGRFFFRHCDPTA